MISAASKAVLISFANLEQSEQFPQQDDIYLPKMRQHGDSWLLGLDLLNRCETLSCISSYYQSQELVQAYLHIRNTIDNWINLPLERASILNLTLASTDLHLPIRVEEIYSLGQGHVATVGKSVVRLSREKLGEFAKQGPYFPPLLFTTKNLRTQA